MPPRSWTAIPEPITVAARNATPAWSVPLDQVRSIRDEIGERVQFLLSELDASAPST